MNSLFIAGWITSLLLGAPSSLEIEPMTVGDLTAQWTCADPQWVNEPGMVNDQFVGILSNECTIEAPNTERNMKGAQDFFIETTNKSRVIHKGPVDETYESLPSKYYDVTVRDQGEEEVVVRQDVHLATDLKTRVIYDMKSTSIEGSGLAGYLRFVATRIQVDGAGPLKVRVRNEVRVEKPWYAPEGIFVSKSKEIALRNFPRLREQLMKGIVSHLE